MIIIGTAIANETRGEVERAFLTFSTFFIEKFKRPPHKKLGQAESYL